jgi:hypothetical protein
VPRDHVQLEATKQSGESRAAPESDNPNAARSNARTTKR